MPIIVTSRPAAAADLPAILKLNASVFGPGRFARTAYRVREGTAPLSPFCRVAVSRDRVIAALRMTRIAIGAETRGLLLGPLAVDPEFKGQGYGRQLVREALEEGRAAGLALVVLVGDEPYYGKLGFVRVPPGQITLPGPVDPMRVLAAELEAGALARVRGMITALK